MMNVSIKNFIDTMFEGERRYIDAQFKSEHRYSDAMDRQNQRYSDTVRQLSNYAIELTRLWTAERLASHNEWRQKAENDSRMYARYSDIENLRLTISAGQDRIFSTMAMMKEQMDMNTGARAGLGTAGTIIIAVIAGLGSAGTIVGGLIALGAFK